MLPDCPSQQFSYFIYSFTSAENINVQHFFIALFNWVYGLF